MQKDDLLVLYSDALIETCKKQGTPFGLDALRKSLRHAGAMPTQDVAERLAGDLRLFADHSDPLKDDLTIITLRRLL